MGFMLYATLLLSFGIQLSDSKIYTRSWAVQVHGNELTARKLAKEYKLKYMGEVFDDIYHLDYHRKYLSVRPDTRLLFKLMKDPRVEWVKQQTLSGRTSRAVAFNDPKYSDAPSGQWYLEKLGVTRAWEKGYHGEGTKMLIIDDGVNYTNADLAANYDASISTDVLSGDSDAMPTVTDSHGTKCAGVAVATGNNLYCGVGVAFKAKFGAVRLLDHYNMATDVHEAKALSSFLNDVDVVVNSWGPPDDGMKMEGPEELTRKALENGVLKGRVGLGRIYAWSVGNGGRDDNCGADGFLNSIYTIAFSSANDDGTVPTYAEPCSAVLATSYSRVITTSSAGCMDNFTGNSAGSAIAAGILAIVLQENKWLTWRDMQHLIVQTANLESIIDRPTSRRTNGVGRNVSHYFGFGLLDADAMLTQAETWKTVPDQVVCHYSSLDNLQISFNTIKANDVINTNVCNCPIKFLEHVQVVTDVNIDHRGALDISLYSPNGTFSKLLWPRPLDTNWGFGLKDWKLMSVFYWGENPVGEWKIELLRKYGRHPGTLNSWKLTLYGTATDPSLGKPRGKHTSSVISENTCKKTIRCPVLSVQNAYIILKSTNNTREMGSTLTFQCDHGYGTSERQADTTITITCRRTGRWTTGHSNVRCVKTSDRALRIWLVILPVCGVLVFICVVYLLISKTKQGARFVSMLRSCWNSCRSLNPYHKERL